jgi:hypothetical protein
VKFTPLVTLGRSLLQRPQLRLDIVEIGPVDERVDRTAADTGARAFHEGEQYGGLPRCPGARRYRGSAGNGICPVRHTDRRRSLHTPRVLRRAASLRQAWFALASKSKDFRPRPVPIAAPAPPHACARTPNAPARPRRWQRPFSSRQTADNRPLPIALDSELLANPLCLDASPRVRDIIPLLFMPFLPRTWPRTVNGSY